MRYTTVPLDFSYTTRTRKVITVYLLGTTATTTLRQYDDDQDQLGAVSTRFQGVYDQYKAHPQWNASQLCCPPVMSLSDEQIRENCLDIIHDPKGSRRKGKKTIGVHELDRKIRVVCPFIWPNTSTKVDQN